MFNKLFCLVTLIAVTGLSSISFGVSLKVDVGICGPKQEGWIPMRGARGSLTKDIGGTNIDVMIVAGANPAKGSGGECRCDSGSKHELAAVETTYIKKDARRKARSPSTDISLTLRDLEPGAEYTLYTYHHRWDENEDPITNVIVTGATRVTKPTYIAQTADIMDNPPKFVFTAGSEDVVITYQCLQKGQPFFNGFRLYGGSATVQFGSPKSSALETVTSAKIPVIINDAQADKTYTVDYAVTGGSAKGGDDYKLASGKLTFAPGSTTEYINLDITDDDVHEDNETIVIELSNVTGPKVMLGKPTKYTYTIIDPRPTVMFTRASGSGMEKDTPAYVPVSLSATTRKKVTVDYAVVGGTATGGGVDYTLDSGTVVFEPGKTEQKIPIVIVADKDDKEPTETIMIKLSNPTNALFVGATMAKEKPVKAGATKAKKKPAKARARKAKKKPAKAKATKTKKKTSKGVRNGTVYCHNIVSQPILLQVDLAVPTCDGKGLYEGLAKPDWTIWAAQSWRDMYMHDGVWLPSKKDPEVFAAGIEGTGVKAFLSTGSEGQLGIGAKGVCRNNLGGGGCPKGKASGDPIANSWAYAVDWAGPYAGDIILLLTDLPAGIYELHSYHNHWEPCKQKNRNCLDCTCGMPPMPSITANPLPRKVDSDQDKSENILSQYRWNLPPGTGKGVKAIESAYNVAPQHVLSDEKLVPSIIKFSTDGSEVLVIYQADRSLPLYPDCARKGREGARGILNAFELVYVGRDK